MGVFAGGASRRSELVYSEVYAVSSDAVEVVSSSVVFGSWVGTRGGAGI